MAFEHRFHSKQSHSKRPVLSFKKRRNSNSLDTTKCWMARRCSRGDCVWYWSLSITDVKLDRARIPWWERIECESAWIPIDHLVGCRGRRGSRDRTISSKPLLESSCHWIGEMVEDPQNEEALRCVSERVVARLKSQWIKIKNDIQALCSMIFLKKVLSMKFKTDWLCDRMYFCVLE